ncbi:Proton pump-interactor 4 [Hirschfeldia incana]|nr:Proton pump-interactor 4 [Hirschfeldia incana]
MGSTKSLRSLCTSQTSSSRLIFTVFFDGFVAQEQMGYPVSICDARRLVIGKSNGDLSSRETTEEDDDYAVFSGEEEEEEEEQEGWREDGFCFYFVKQFAYDDPEIKAKIEEADNEIYNCNSERIHIANSLKAKRAEILSLMSSSQEINSLSERLSEVKMEMELLNAQMACVLDHRDRAVDRIKLLRVQRDKGNAAFFQSRVVMKKAIELAACGNFRDLEELSNSEVDKFMSRWNNDKAFREDYKKRIIPSLEERKLRRQEQIRSSESDVDTENRDETTGKKAIELKRFSNEEEESDEKEEEEEILKEKKREEQLEKARMAMERKRKRHEKAAARAAVRDKKEAEKKLKELEKRENKKKKKASSPSGLEQTPETVTEGSEPEKKPLNGRSVNCKQRSLRYRHHKKGNESVPKAILKRRRAYRLWVWSVSSAAVALPLALFIVFFYLR